jgi:hypothetical protein
VAAFYDFVTKWSQALVFVLSIVGITLAVVILAPWALDKGLADRANISTAVATVFALFAAFFALSAGLWVTTTDYRAQQAAKRDTAWIRATVQSMFDKADAKIPSPRKGQPGSRIDTFKAEREAMNEFVLTTTAFGYRKWIVTRLLEQQRAEKQGAFDDPWVHFFPQLTYLMEASQPPANTEAVKLLSAHLQVLLNKLEPKDLLRISSLAGNLTGKFELLAPTRVTKELEDEKRRQNQADTVAAFDQERTK